MFGDKDKSKFRWRLLVYPKFQLALITVNALIFFSAFSAVGIQTYRAFHRLQVMGKEANLPETHAYFNFVEFQSHLMYANLAVAMVVAFALSCFITLLISHRLAGPLVRVQKHFEKIAQTGEMSPLNFRKGDFLSELPNIINKAFTSIKEKDDDSRKAA